MNDIEDRLRTSLGELADTVPASPHARADLARRLTRRPDRRPWLVAAAAAVVIAAAVVPVVVNQGRDRVSGDGVPAPTTTTRAPAGTTTSKLPNGDLTGWIELASFEHDGADMTAVLAVTAMTDGEHWCVDVDYPPGYPPTLGGYCDIVPTWPAHEPPGSLVLTHGVLIEEAPGSGPLPNLMLLITSPKVTTVEVGDAMGAPVPVRQVAKTPGATFYLADFPETYVGFRYTAKDANGTVLESAIN